MELIRSKVDFEEIKSKLHTPLKELLIKKVTDISELYKQPPEIDFEGTRFEKIIYPKDKPILLSNAFNGGFEYHYELNLLELLMENARILETTVMELGQKKQISYLVEKINNDKPAYCFFQESIELGMTGYETLILIEI